MLCYSNGTDNNNNYYYCMIAKKLSQSITSARRPLYRISRQCVHRDSSANRWNI